MQFCNDCGGALNLFETNDDELCWSCRKKGEKQPPKAPGKPLETEDLAGATLSLEGDMLVLRAEEGWVLWSGPSSQSARLGDIVKRSRRIHQIRMKRVKATK